MPHPYSRKPRRGTFPAAADLSASAWAGWALALFLVPLPLLAQATPGSVEVGYGVGRFIGGTLAKGSNEAFDYKVDVDDDPTGGFWLAAQLSPQWGVELAYRRTTTHVIGYRGGVFASQQELADLAMASFEALAVRSFRSGSFIPYVGAGVGLVNLDIDVPDRSYRDANRGALALTAGARFFLTRWAGVRFDLRGRATYLGQRSLGEDGGWTDNGRWFADAELTGGVFVSLGGH
jgi:opacity protein-like surface antigen